MAEIAEIRKLSKKYGAKSDYAVRDISFSCGEGQIVGMVGRNGAGKSTILKCLTGLLPFSEGRIFVCGHDISEDSISAKACFGYVPDVCFAFDKMTGIEYLNFLADVHRVSKSDRAARVKEFQARFSLGDSIHRLISSYSHGMKQKISVMASLIHRPRLWILDEPHTGLDPQTTAALKNYMQEYAAQGNTVLFSSHNLDIVEKICDRVVMINRGRKTEDMEMTAFRRTGRSLEEYFIAKCEEPPEQPEEKTHA